MTDNPREQLVEIGAAALLRRFSPAPDEDVTFDSAEWFQIARLDAADILDAVFAERELVIAALGGTPVYRRTVYIGWAMDEFSATYEPGTHVVYAFSSVGERQETP